MSSPAWQLPADETSDPYHPVKEVNDAHLQLLSPAGTMQLLVGRHCVVVTVVNFTGNEKVPVCRHCAFLRDRAELARLCLDISCVLAGGDVPDRCIRTHGPIDLALHYRGDGSVLLRADVAGGAAKYIELQRPEALLLAERLVAICHGG